jgi:hypothetical protein
MTQDRFKKLKESLKQAIQHARFETAKTTELSDRDRDKFLEEIKRDEPNDNLKSAFSRCHEMFGEDDDS